jgi:DNA-binding response OmpR family regulator
LRLDHIRVRRFAAALLFSGDVEELPRLSETPLGIRDLALGRGNGVVILNDGKFQAAYGNIRFGARHRFGGRRQANLAAPRERQQFFVGLQLLVVDVHAIVSHKHSGSGSVALRVDELIKAVHRWQRGRLRLRVIFMRQRSGDVGGFNLRSVLVRARERIRKINRQILGRQPERPGRQRDEYSNRPAQSCLIETGKPEKMVKAIPGSPKARSRNLQVSGLGCKRQMQILAVEDEVAMADLLRSALSDEGHLVTLATDGQQALALARTGRFDLLVLDLLLPGIDGFEVARQLRRARIQTPILVLTARDRSQDIVAALDAGADDYLTKPFSLDVFLARVRAVSRRGEIPQPVCLETAGLSLNTATREVTRSGRQILLTPREYSLLELLMRHKGRVLPRSAIVEAVWGFDTEIEENTLDAFIRLLRNKIEFTGAPRLIRTVRGIGYSLAEHEL